MASKREKGARMQPSLHARAARVTPHSTLTGMMAHMYRMVHFDRDADIISDMKKFRHSCLYGTTDQWVIFVHNLDSFRDKYLSGDIEVAEFINAYVQGLTRVNDFVHGLMQRFGNRFLGSMPANLGHFFPMSAALCVSLCNQVKVDKHYRVNIAHFFNSDDAFMVPFKKACEYQSVDIDSATFDILSLREAPASTKSLEKLAADLARHVAADGVNQTCVGGRELWECAAMTHWMAIKGNKAAWHIHSGNKAVWIAARKSGRELCEYELEQAENKRRKLAIDEQIEQLAAEILAFEESIQSRTS